jgi:hypothetical protein
MIDDEEVCELMGLGVPDLAIREFHAGSVARGALHLNSALFQGAGDMEVVRAEGTDVLDLVPQLFEVLSGARYGVDFDCLAARGSER